MSILKNAHAGEFFYYRPITSELLTEYGFVLKHNSYNICRWDYEGVDIAEITRNRQSNAVSDLYNDLPNIRDRDCVYQDNCGDRTHFAVEFTFLGNNHIRKIKHEKDLEHIVNYFKAITKKERENTAAILYNSLKGCDWQVPNCSYRYIS